MARFHPDKGWKPAVRVIDRLKKVGRKPVLVARGGEESYGRKIRRQAISLGLNMKDITLAGNSRECYHRAVSEDDFTPYLEAICKGGVGDILNLLFPIPQSFLRVIYSASDVVLANSNHEPFGLVGLEAMASGAVVFTGCSGEDYATHMYNAVVLDTFSAKEIHYYIEYLRVHPEIRKTISIAAKQTAEQWTWEEVIRRLLCKLEYQARLQGVELPAEGMVQES